MIKFLLLFLLCPAVAFAGTITGIAKKAGTVWEGAIVRCYLYNDAVANVVLADSDTTAADGSYTLTTTNEQTHLLVVIDPDDVKKAIIKVVTPDAD